MCVVFVLCCLALALGSVSALKGGTRAQLNMFAALQIFSPFSKVVIVIVPPPESCSVVLRIFPHSVRVMVLIVWLRQLSQMLLLATLSMYLLQADGCCAVRSERTRPADVQFHFCAILWLLQRHMG